MQGRIGAASAFPRINMKTQSKTPVEKAGAIRIPLSQIVSRDDLKPRWSLTKHHVQDLRQAVKRGSKLPSILVWQEEENGKTTGRLVLLDGRHRLAAYREAKPRMTEVMAEVFRGPASLALLTAAERNTKLALPLTRWEATNAAWAVVRMSSPKGEGATYTMSKAQIARACAISPRAVATMRARWRAWPEDQEPLGDWQRDMRDNTSHAAEPVDEDEYRKQREALIAQTTKELDKAIGSLSRTDVGAVGEALSRVMGWRMPQLLDYLGMDPEAASDEMPWAGIEGEDDPNNPSF